jgi:hypothetical protein
MCSDDIADVFKPVVESELTVHNKFRSNAKCVVAICNDNTKCGNSEPRSIDSTSRTTRDKSSGVPSFRSSAYFLQCRGISVMCSRISTLMIHAPVSAVHSAQRS